MSNALRSAGNSETESSHAKTQRAQRSIAATKEENLTTDEHEWTRMGEGRGKRRGMNLNS